MDALVDACLEHNLIPPVIPEFPGITVGGAFAGTAGESSSFRYGFFDNTVNWCEVILADGTVVRCSGPDGAYQDRADLFKGLKGTFGTLGVGVLFEVRLIPAARYVEVTYIPISRGIEEAKQVIKDACARPPGEIDFVDGIVFSKLTAVIMTGRLTDSNDDGLPIITFHQPWDEWFYLHAQNILNSSLPKVSTSPRQSTRPRPSIAHTVSTHDSPYAQTLHRDLVPLKSYLFRYDRGAFWTGRYAYSYFITPFNRMTRYVLDYFMHTRVMYHALHRSGMMEQFIIQDMALPWSTISPFVDWINERFQIYPQWLCPLDAGGAGGGLNPHAKSSALNSESADAVAVTRQKELILNIGVWGPSPGEPVATNRAIEAKLLELRGMKWLYAQTFYTEEEFWSIYDKESYQALRKKYGATALPDVYKKVGWTGRNKGSGLTGFWGVWPFAGVYGVLSCLKGGDYLRKDSRWRVSSDSMSACA